MVLGDMKVEDFRGGSHGSSRFAPISEGRFSFQGVPDSDSTRAQARTMEEASWMART